MTEGGFLPNEGTVTPPFPWLRPSAGGGRPGLESTLFPQSADTPSRERKGVACQPSGSVTVPLSADGAWHQRATKCGDTVQCDGRPRATHSALATDR